MNGIPVFAANADDYANNGLGLVFPQSASVEWTAGGLHELTLELPIDDELRWSMVGNESIIKCPVPMRESPYYETEESYDVVTETTVSRKLYKVRTNSGARLRLHSKASDSSKTLGYYAVGTVVIQMAAASGGWMRVSIQKGGAVGYMKTAYLDYWKTVTETKSTVKPGGTEAVSVQVARDQLFRVYSPQPDTTAGTVTVSARHIFYDLAQNIVMLDYKPKNVDIKTAVETCFNALSDAHPFTLHCLASGNVTGEYGYKDFVSVLLDGDEAMLAQVGARLLVDNFDIWILPALTRDMGVTIRRGKNLNGIKVTYDGTDVVTRILPTGQKSDGGVLVGTVVESTHLNDYAVNHTRRIEYDVKVGTGDGEFGSETLAKAELNRLALADLAAGCDMPVYGLDVDLVMLQGDDAWTQLQAIHGDDIVTVIDEVIGLRTQLAVSYYKYDVIAEQFDAVTLGAVSDVEASVTGANIVKGSVEGSRLVGGSVGNAQLRDLSIQYAKINQATINQLNADSVTAVTGAFNSITTSTISTDTLYAAIAHMFSLAVQSVQAERIESDALASVLANFVTLTARVANIDLANITAAVIGKLILKNDDGYYQLGVDANGNVTAVLISAEQAASSGKYQVEEDISAEDLTAENVNGNNVLTGEILNAAHLGGGINDVELFYASASITTLYTQYIKSLGSSIRFEAGGTLSELGDNIGKWMTFSAADGLRVESPVNGANYYTQTDENGYHVYRKDMVQPLMSAEGRGIQSPAIRVGNIIAKKTSRGGWAFVDA